MNMAIALRLKKKRKERQDFSAFRALITTPATLPFSLPAAGRIHISSDADQPTSPSPVIDVASRTLHLPANLPADQASPIGFFEAHQTLEKDAAAVGVLTVYLEDSFGRLFKIGEG